MYSFVYRSLGHRSAQATTFLPMNNWKTARELLHRNGTPCIPYIGIFLTDLVYIDEANPDTDRTPDGVTLINFDKHRKTATVIQVVMLHRNG